MRARVQRDVAELFDKYSGDLYIRRPGHPKFGQQVTVQEVILVYEGGPMISAELGQIIMSEARAAATRINPSFDFHVTFQ